MRTHQAKVSVVRSADTGECREETEDAPGTKFGGNEPPMVFCSCSVLTTKVSRPCAFSPCCPAPVTQPSNCAFAKSSPIPTDKLGASVTKRFGPTITRRNSSTEHVRRLCSSVPLATSTVIAVSDGCHANAWPDTVSTNDPRTVSSNSAKSNCLRTDDERSRCSVVPAILSVLSAAIC